MFALNMYSVQYTADSKRVADISKAQYSIPWPNRIMGLLKEGKISFSLWLNTNAGKLFLMQPPYSKDLRRRAMCPGIAVTFEIRSTLAKRITFCSWYVHCIPRTFCYLSAIPLACRGIFLTPTLSFIDRGCYLEKQKKKRKRTDRKGGRGRQEKKNKSLASKAYEITECPLISRAWLLFRKCKHSHWKSISLLFSKTSSYFRQ